MKVVYMGTPEFAVAALDSIVKAGHEVIACFTQPDKPKGRGKALQKTPVKQRAESYQIPVYQPVKIREEENVQLLQKLAPEIIVVAAFGQILPESILNIPKYGCVNIHASLLPKYRGAAPIEWAILNGETESGVTTMFMEKGLDTGDMLDVTRVAITPEDTGASLHDKLAEAGAALILQTMEKLEKGTAQRVKQKDEECCYASMLNKEMGRMDFTKSAAELERLMRGLYPWPCAYTRIDGKNVKLYRAEVTEDSGAPGEIIEVTKKSFTIACGQGALRIKSLQPEGKKAMDAAAYLNGNKLTAGMIAGEKE
jgi:methionyl-tRNA formyltransferase